VRVSFALFEFLVWCGLVWVVSLVAGLGVSEFVPVLEEVSWWSVFIVDFVPQVFLECFDSVFFHGDLLGVVETWVLGTHG